MPSRHFNNLSASIFELKRIYLDAALASPMPTLDHQELARAFVMLAHAEFEYFVEEALRELAGMVLANAGVGTYSKSSLAMLSLTGLSQLTAGKSLNDGKRKVASRIGEGYNAILKTLDSNNGVREKYLTAMAVPLGLEGNQIDSTWIGDLDTFCSWRGLYAHKSRTTQEATPLSVNPLDVWTKCNRLVWANSQLVGQTLIASFQEFDNWVEFEKATFGPLTSVRQWHVRAYDLLRALVVRR